MLPLRPTLETRTATPAVRAKSNRLAVIDGDVHPAWR